MPPVDVVRMRTVDWVIITEENFAEVVAKAKKDDKTIAFFALTDEGYAALGLNFSDIRALVQQQKAIIGSYETYYNTIEKLEEEEKVKKDIDKWKFF